MITPFNIEHLGRFLPNEFSSPDVVLPALIKPTNEVHTIWCGEMVAAISCCWNYWGDCWEGFFLIADDMPVKAISELREHILERMGYHKASRLQTRSVACLKLDHWHEWLGFKWEGHHEKMIFGKNFNSWALMRDQVGG